MLVRVYCVLSVFLFLFFTPAHAGQDRWQDVVNEIDGVLYQAADAYGKGDKEGAKALVSDAYFNIFEGSGMEMAVNLHISSNRKSELEAMFGSIRAAINANAPESKLREKIDVLVNALSDDSKKLPERSSGGTAMPSDGYMAIFFNSFIIILREGFEAILVISALTAYLAKTNHKNKIKVVYNGALMALAASIVTAVLLQTVIKISGAGREALEGVTMLFATAVLFYVSYWLISKMEVARWQHYIKSKVESSLSKGSVFALGFAAFLAVYREGAETILFYQALYSASGDNSGAIVMGFAAGSILLVGLFMLIKYGSIRIPIAPFFAVTSTILYYLAFTFAGKGIRELQEALWISSTPVEWLPTISFLGIYPTWEGILLQAILILALLVAIVYSFVLRPYKEMITVTKDISHIESDIKNLHDILDDVSQHTMTAHGLASGIAGQETEEIRKHLVDIDKKVHEVARHLDKLAKGLEDIFAEIERDIKRG